MTDVVPSREMRFSNRKLRIFSSDVTAGWNNDIPEPEVKYIPAWRQFRSENKIFKPEVTYSGKSKFPP